VPGQHDARVGDDEADVEAVRIVRRAALERLHQVERETVASDEHREGVLAAQRDEGEAEMSSEERGKARDVVGAEIEVVELQVGLLSR